MRLLTIIIVLAILGLMTEQLIVHGWADFIFRPPGTGATIAPNDN